MTRFILALALAAAVQGPAPQLAGRWRLEHYERERVAADREGRAATETITIPAEISLIVSTAGDFVNVVTTSSNGIPFTKTDRYQLDGIPRPYTWGDAIPPDTGIRLGHWRDTGFVVTDHPHADDPAREESFTVAPDNEHLIIEIRYPPSAAPPSTHAPVRDLQIFTRES